MTYQNGSKTGFQTASRTCGTISEILDSGKSEVSVFNVQSYVSGIESFANNP